MSVEELVRTKPRQFAFYPSAEVQKKLIDKMLKIKDNKIEKQLWQGFIWMEAPPDSKQKSRWKATRGIFAFGQRPEE